MKRWIWLAAAMAAVMFLSTSERAGTDVAKLRPVQTLWVSVSDGWVVVETESGEVGVGMDFVSAVKNMEAAADSEIFFQTAEYLLMDEAALPQTEQLAQYLRPSCVVCLTSGAPMLERAAQFLEQHRAEITLQQFRADGRALPILHTSEGRMTLVQ